MDPEPADRETVRMEAFSDGIFAIAITLLVLDLKVPLGATSDASLGERLLEERTAFLSFVLSFFTILVIWATHHAVLRRVHRVNGNLLFANGLLLLVVVAVPFPTALLGQYLGREGERLAAAVYSCYYALIACTFALLLAVTLHNPRLVPMQMSDAEIRMRERRPRIAFAGYATAAVAAAWSAWASLAVCVVVWVYWFSIAYRNHRLAPAATVEASHGTQNL